METGKRLEMLCDIIECFENLLDEYHIEIPNPEKHESGDYECCSNIYGTDYGNLENAILDVLTCYGLLK